MAVFVRVWGRAHRGKHTPTPTPTPTHTLKEETRQQWPDWPTLPGVCARLYLRMRDVYAYVYRLLRRVSVSFVCVHVCMTIAHTRGIYHIQTSHTYECTMIPHIGGGGRGRRRLDEMRRGEPGFPGWHMRVRVCVRAPFAVCVRERVFVCMVRQLTRKGVGSRVDQASAASPWKYLHSTQHHTTARAGTERPQRVSTQDRHRVSTQSGPA